MNVLNQWAIQTQGLTKVYGRQAVVNEIDLTVPANSIFGFWDKTAPEKARQ